MKPRDNAPVKIPIELPPDSVLVLEYRMVDGGTSRVGLLVPEAVVMASEFAPTP